MLGASVLVASCAAVPPAGVICDAHRPPLICGQHKMCLIRQIITTIVLVIAKHAVSRRFIDAEVLVCRRR